MAIMCPSDSRVFHSPQKHARRVVPANTWMVENPMEPHLQN